MACDIRKIVDKLHAVIDTSIKGSAMSITQKDNGNFSVIWGDSFRIKTRAQAIRAAEQKVDTAHKKADEAGFNHKVFGPYLAIDTSPENEIIIKKLPTTKLERALEIRNEAQEKDKAIAEVMSEQDREFFDTQRADTELLDQQNDNTVPLGITNTKNEYFDITKSKFEEKDQIVNNSGAKSGKYGYYYVLTKDQQKNYEGYSSKHVSSTPGSSKKGFELSRTLNQVTYLKKVRGKHYLYIDLKHLVNHNDVLLPEIYGKVRFPIDLVFHNEEQKYLKSFEEEKPFISEQEQEIRKLMFKTEGISAPKAANFYIFNIKDAIVKLIKSLGGNISYSELNNITEENLDYIKSLVNIDEKVDKLAKDYKEEIDNLDEDQLKLQIISSIESDYDSDTLQGIWKVINRLPVSFLKLLSFEFVDSSTAYFMAESEKNKESKSVDVRSITQNESIIIGTSINVALRRMLDDGLITNEELNKLNKRIRTDIDIHLEAQKGKIITYEQLKQFIKRSSYIKYLSTTNYDAFKDYRDKAINDIEEYITRQNKGIVQIVDFLSKLRNKSLNRIHTNITLGKFDPIKDLLKFPIDYTVIASHELGHAVDYYLQTTKPEIRGKLNDFITKLTLLPEFSNYLEKGLYSRNYSINDTKEIAADLYAWMMAKSTGYDVSNSHISSLDKFMYDNEVVVERLFKEIFDIKTPSSDISSIKSNPIETVIDYIKRLIDGLVEWVNESLNTTLYSSDNGEIKLEPAGLAVQRLLLALDRLTMRDENFDIESILNSQSQKDFFNGVKNELYKKEGVSELFESNPELNRIGDVFSYSIYLDTIFPDSKVKDIVYHNTDAIIEKFQSIPVAKFFTKSPLGGKKYRLPILLSITNPKVFSKFTEDDEMTYGLAEMYAKNKERDGIINGTEGETRTEYIVFEPEQIHILGSKQDIEGFKKFVKSNNLSNNELDIASLKEGIKNDVYKKMFEDNPQEFLKFVAEQFYGISNGTFSSIKAATDETISYFGEGIVEAALDAHPLDSLLKPDGLPPIEPSC